MSEIGIVNVLVNTGAFGLLVWIAVYWLPKASALYSVAVEKMTVAHEQEVGKTVAAFQAEQHYEREQCQRQFGALMESIQQGQLAVSRALDHLEKQFLLHHHFAEQSVMQIKDLSKVATEAVAATATGKKPPA